MCHVSKKIQHSSGYFGSKVQKYKQNMLLLHSFLISFFHIRTGILSELGAKLTETIPQFSGLSIHQK